MITLNYVKNINYNKKDLEKLFIDYNECSNSGYINYEFKQKKDFYKLSVRPGINISNLEFDFGYIDIDLGNKLNLRFGIESEFILPFNKNKWGIIIEPTYQYYKSDKTTETNNVSGGIIVTEVNYQSIELPIGVRHYFFLNDKSKVYANISYIFDYNKTSKIKLTRKDGTIINSLEIKSRRNLGLEIGYKFKDKYSVGMKYQTGRDILGNYLNLTSNYSTFSIIFGFKLF